MANRLQTFYWFLSSAFSAESDCSPFWACVVFYFYATHHFSFYSSATCYQIDVCLGYFLSSLQCLIIPGVYKAASWCSFLAFFAQWGDFSHFVTMPKLISSQYVLGFSLTYNIPTLFMNYDRYGALFPSSLPAPSPPHKDILEVISWQLDYISLNR